MNMTKRVGTLTLLLLLSFAVTGCFFAGITSGPQMPPTPPPVVAIEPPEGIRSTLSTDPRHFYALEMARGDSPDRTVPDNGGLHMCYTADESMLEAQSLNPKEFTAFVSMQVCGWENQNAQIDIRLSLPDGTVINRTEPVQKPAYRGDRLSVNVFEQVVVSDATMPIFIEIVREDSVFSAEQTYHLPTSPRGYSYESGDVWLYGFEPQEHVQFLRYDISERGYVEWDNGGGITETYTLVATESGTVESNGTLLLRGFASLGSGPYGPHSIVIALAENSGEVRAGAGMPFVEGTVFE